MPIRLSGIASNMDTDAIVKELMNAQSLKKTKVENKLTKLQWTKDAWKDMNSKIYKFYTGPLSKLKTQGSYATKKATSSNESKVTVKAGVGAATGSHNVQVKQLASAQYVTGVKLGDNVTGNTKLSELGFDVVDGKESVVQITNGGKVTELYVTKETTLSDFTEACNKAGLNASFDNTQKRIFLSSKQSGEDNVFSIATKTVNVSSDREDVRNLLGYHNSTTSGATRYEMDKAIDTYVKLKSKDGSRTAEEEKTFEATVKKLNDYMKSNTTSKLSAGYESALAEELAAAGVKSAAEAEQDARDNYTGDPDDQKAIDAAVKSAINTERNKFVKYYQNQYQEILGKDSASLTEEEKKNPYYVNQTNMILALEGAAATEVAPGEEINTNSLDKIGIGTITNIMEGDKLVSKSTVPGASVVSAANSIIVYNGAELEGSSNQVTANGVTFELHGVTEGSDTVSLTIANDTDAVYDMVRNFVKGYNELLQEMNTLYNANSSRGYNPLTDDEKEAMTDDQIEKWEQKIKDSLLRRDDKLSGVLSTMRTNMAGSVTVNGKNLSLSTFGIVTGAYTEKGILHIAGDSEDSLYAGDTDKLKKALSENPDEVIQVLTKLANNLYQDISDKMKSTSLSSALTIYNDKEMDKLETRYKKDLATLEKKLKNMEDRYYKQFSAMETAMSKLNSQSSQLSSMLGL